MRTTYIVKQQTGVVTKQWGVYTKGSNQLVEGGFSDRDAAEDSASEWNALSANEEVADGPCVQHGDYGCMRCHT